MLDGLDQKIMRELQNDGRQSNRNIARKLSVAEGTIRKRVKHLRNDDVLRITAVPNPTKLGCNTICFMGLEVKLTKLHQVGKKLALDPHVYYLAHVTGHFDLMGILFFQTPRELSKFIEEQISKIPGIERTETLVNTEIVKEPWASLLDTVELLKP